MISRDIHNKFIVFSDDTAASGSHVSAVPFDHDDLKFRRKFNILYASADPGVFRQDRDPGELKIDRITVIVECSCDIRMFIDHIKYSRDRRKQSSLNGNGKQRDHEYHMEKIDA